MRKWCLFALVAVATVVVTTALLPDAPASVPPERIYLSLNAPGLKNLNNIPPNCSTWIELWPDFGRELHQSNYQDNGDGVVSECDIIVFDDGEEWHIIWSGPTYYLRDVVSGALLIVEPNLAPHDPSNPVCEVWHEIWPHFCNEFHVEWHESQYPGDPIRICDMIGGSDGRAYHVEDIRLNIITEPNGGVSTEDHTWGRIKNWFRNLGN